MSAPTPLSDTLFIQELESCTLNPSLFNHEAHLRLAWLLIRAHGIETATDKTCRLIRNYTRFLGVEDKFNVTLTVAATRAVYHFMLKDPEPDFSVFIRQQPRLLTSFTELMAAHYSFDIYQAAGPKAAYVAPDLLPFD